MENTIFAPIAKKSNYLKADILTRALHVASEMTKSRKHFVVKSVDLGRFLTSEGTKTLILTLTSKPGQPVERSRHRIF